MNRDTFLFGSLLSMRAVGMAASVVLVALIGRILGPVGLGRWSLIVAGATFVHTMFLGWTHDPTVRYGCEEWARDRSLARTMSARTPLVVLGLVAGFGLVALEPPAVGTWFGVSAGGWWLVGCYVPVVWLNSEVQTTLQATDRLGVLAIAGPVARLSGVAAVVVVVLAGRATLTGIVLALSFGQVSVSTAIWLHTLWTARLHWEPSRSETWRQVRYAWPLIPGLALGFVSGWAGHLLLRTLSTISEVGLFAVAYQVLLAAVTVNGLLRTILLPRLLVRQVASTDTLRRYLTTVAPTLLALWVLAANWAIAIAPPVLVLAMGHRFDAAVPFLVVLCVAMPSHVIASLYSVLFNVQERLGRSFWYSAAMTVANVAVCLGLIPTIGPIGAAVGTALSYVTIQVLYVRDQHAYEGVPGGRVWLLLGVTLALGVLQVPLGAAWIARLAWAVLATLVLIPLIRRARLVDPDVVATLLGGSLQVVGRAASQLLVRDIAVPPLAPYSSKTPAAS